MGRTLAIGVSYLGMGTPGDGVPASTFTQFTHIDQNTVAFGFNDATIRSFKIEGTSDPWAVIVRSGGDADYIDFVLPSPTAEELVRVAGGEIVSGEWQAPPDTPDIVQSLRLVTLPYQGKQIQYTFTIGKVFAKPNQAPNEENAETYLVRFYKQAAITSGGIKKSPYQRKVIDVPAEG